MSTNIIRMVEKDIEQPNYGPEPAEGAIEGTPLESTHEYYSKDGNTTGVWTCSSGRMLEENHAEDEFVTLLSGKLGIIDNEDGREEIFGAGDSFFLPKGSSLTWVVYEPVRKFYMTAE
ncbi:MAG: cupin domain-containing protein [Acidimicrobiia bacterium]